MANYWYVSSVSGIADINTLRTTTDITVQRTGAFTAMAAADHYPTIAAAFLGDATGLPVAGDFIFVANDHSFSSSSSITYGSATAVDTPVNVISVLETACDQYTAGSAEATTGGSSDMVLAVAGAKVSFTGVDLSCTDNLQFLSITGTSFSMRSGTLTFDTSPNQIAIGGDGIHVNLKDTTVVFTLGTTKGLFVNPYGGHIELENVIIDDGSGTVDNLIEGGGINGAFIVNCINCDFSQIESYIWRGFGSNSVDDDHMSCIMQNCKVNATSDPFVEEDFFSAGQYFLATNCANTSAAAEYQFYQKTMGGTVRDSGDDSTSPAKYREESLAFDGGNKISFKWDTTAQCGEGSPLWCGLMNAKVVDLTSTATLTFYITQVDTNVNLTTANTWFEVSYPLVADKSSWDTKSSRATDILSATELTADGGDSDWRDHTGTALTGHDEYKISVTTVGGALCVPSIKMFTTVANTTFNVAVRFGTS